MITENQAQKMDRDELKRRHRLMLRMYEQKDMIERDEEDPERVRVEGQIIMLSRLADNKLQGFLDT